MEKTKKYYAKAMDYYCKGNPEKALEYCERSLSTSRNYSPTLNLKGLIYYIKGDLEQSQLIWRANYKVNNDGISKKYLDDSKKDYEVLEIFTKGVNYYKEIKIHQALECFKQCEKSHFNIINLWNYIAQCYMKTGEYEECNKYIQEVLKVDKNNQVALATRKILTDLGMAKRQVNPRKIYMVALGALLLMLCMVVYYNKDMIKSVHLFDKFSNIATSIENKNKDEKNTELNENGEDTSKKIIINEKDNSSLSEEKPESNNLGNKNIGEAFNFQNIKENLDKKNYEELINYLEIYNKDDLTLNEKALLVKVEEEIKSQGIKYFYDKAMENIRNNNFSEALIYLNKIYKYSSESYLEEHITYMMGFAYEKILDVENANKYYETYVSKFDKGSYVDASLYNLALLNENIDLEKAKKYALLLSKDYKNSQYNNSKINSIINR